MNRKLLFPFVLLIFCTPFFPAQKSYNTHVFEGNKEFDKKNYEASSSKYLEAIKINEKDFSAHYNLGNSLYKRKMFEEATAEYEKAEKLATNVADKAAALYNLGNVYMQTHNTKKAAALYKQALKQDPYNENIRKNYEIAKLKEKEKEQNKQQNKSGGGNDQDQDQNQGSEKGNTPQNESGQGRQNKGEGSGEDSNKNKNDNSGKLPKDLESSILNRVENKERETAKRILNKNSYSMPRSNEKDW